MAAHRHRGKAILKRSQRAANDVVIVLLKDPGNGRFKHIVRNTFFFCQECT